MRKRRGVGREGRLDKVAKKGQTTCTDITDSLGIKTGAQICPEYQSATIASF